MKQKEEQILILREGHRYKKNRRILFLFQLNYYLGAEFQGSCSYDPIFPSFILF